MMNTKSQPKLVQSVKALKKLLQSGKIKNKTQAHYVLLFRLT